MTALHRTLNSRAFFWLLLSLPAVPMIADLIFSDDARIIRRLVHPTGDFSARFLILALMATPLTLLLPGWRGPRWLMKRRRYLGVAAFGYAVAHTALYLVAKSSLSAVLEDALRAGIWTGWIAFLIFTPLAVTSTDGWVRRLGPRWKALQRWVYPAAALTLAHWLLVSHAPLGALLHFAPLALLEGYRIWWNLDRRRRPAQ